MLGKSILFWVSMSPVRKRERADCSLNKLASLLDILIRKGEQRCDTDHCEPRSVQNTFKTVAINELMISFKDRASTSDSRTGSGSTTSGFRCEFAFNSLCQKRKESVSQSFILDASPLAVERRAGMLRFQKIFACDERQLLRAARLSRSRIQSPPTRFLCRVTLRHTGELR